jgi:uncharacterized membrane protein
MLRHASLSLILFLLFGLVLYAAFWMRQRVALPEYIDVILAVCVALLWAMLQNRLRDAHRAATSRKAR